MQKNMLVGLMKTLRKLHRKPKVGILTVSKKLAALQAVRCWSCGLQSRCLDETDELSAVRLLLMSAGAVPDVNTGKPVFTS